MLIDEQRPHYDEEVRLVSEILQRADRTPRPNPLLLLTWGMVGTVVDLAYFWYYYRLYARHDHPPVALLQIAYIALSIGLVVTALRAFMQRLERRTLVDRAIAINFSVAAAMGIGLVFMRFPRWVMSGPDYAIAWNLLTASAAAAIGLQFRAWPLLIGAIVLVGTVVASTMNPYFINLFLAVGMFGGLVLPGLFYALRERRA